VLPGPLAVPAPAGATAGSAPLSLSAAETGTLFGREAIDEPPPPAASPAPWALPDDPSGALAEIRALEAGSHPLADEPAAAADLGSPEARPAPPSPPLLPVMPAPRDPRALLATRPLPGDSKGCG
jgi:hypothetical protein